MHRSRADQEKQMKFLYKLGADYVVHTEMDMAFRDGNPVFLPECVRLF